MTLASFSMTSVRHAALGIKRPENPWQSLPAKAKLKISRETSGGVQEMNAVTLGGLFDLISRSRSDIAVKFQAFLNYELLPAIQRDGHYRHAPKVLLMCRALHEQTVKALRTSVKKEYKACETRADEIAWQFPGKDSQLLAAELVGPSYRIAMHQLKELRASLVEVFGEHAYCCVLKEQEDLNPSHYKIPLEANKLPW